MEDAMITTHQWLGRACSGLALLAISAFILTGTALAQSNAQPDASRGGAAAPSSKAPSDTGSGGNGQGSNDACAQASGMSSGDCSPSSVGSDEKSRVPPMDDTPGAPNRASERSPQQPTPSDR
jgi:hypothetical protein